jgi:hypothetical protein
MRSFHEGQLVTVLEDRDELEGIVVHVPSLVKIEVVVPDAERGPVFRFVHPKVLRDRTAAGDHDEALRRLIRRTASAGRPGPRSGPGGGRGRRGHSQPTGHRNGAVHSS